MFKQFILIFFLLCSVSDFYAAAIPVYLGDEIVWIKKQNHGPGKAFIHLHQNEKTALKAAYAVVQKQGGSVITLVHRGGRNIVFRLNHQRYEFDPNRIFTKAGIKQTLKCHGSYSQAAHQQVNQLATQIKALLPQGKIIAVHNNQFYSMREYYPGGALAKEAGALHLNHAHQSRNFYLVTQRKDYLRLKRLNFNSILQTVHPRDDGSLSVYLATRPYVNVEAGHGELALQMQMLRQA